MRSLIHSFILFILIASILISTNHYDAISVVMGCECDEEQETVPNVEVTTQVTEQIESVGSIDSYSGDRFKRPEFLSSLDYHNEEEMIKKYGMTKHRNVSLIQRESTLESQSILSTYTIAFKKKSYVYLPPSMVEKDKDVVETETEQSKEEIEAAQWKARNLLFEVFNERKFFFPRSTPQDFKEEDFNATLVWLRIPLPVVETHDFPENLYKKIHPPFLINRYPAMAQEINAKHSIAKNIQKMKLKYGSDEFDFHPETYILPEDYELLKSLDQQEPTNWIMKPKFGGRGTGIHLFNNTKYIPNNSDYIVQKYITNPFLINNRKFTIRMYVLITSLDPLVAYIHNNGVIKFATSEFQPNINTFNDANIAMHITNQAVNSGKSGFTYSYDINVDNVGSRWSLKAFWKYLDENNLYDSKLLWKNIKDTMVKALFSVETNVLNATNTLSSHDSSFQLLGVDMDLLDDFKPIFIEANTNAQLGGSPAPFDNLNKLHLIRETFDILGFTTYDPLSLKDEIKQELIKSMDTTADTNNDNVDTPNYIHHDSDPMSIDPLHFQTIKSQPQKQQLDLDRKLDILTKFEFEKLHQGNYELIYPTINSHLSEFHQNKDSPSNQFLSQYFTSNNN